jgi:hypothetical protein
MKFTLATAVVLTLFGTTFAYGGSTGAGKVLLADASRIHCCGCNADITWHKFFEA